MTVFTCINNRLPHFSRSFKAIAQQLLVIGFFLMFVGTQSALAQATCGTCATPNCIGIKQYANKTAVLTGTGKVTKTYSPALTNTTGIFTVYVTITTDANGQVGVMQEILMNGTSTGLTAQVGAVAATRTAVLYAVSDATCASAIFPANITNDGCSTTFNPAWTNLAPNTNYKLALTTNLTNVAAGYTYTGFNIRFYNAVRPIATLAFNCGTATYLGAFTANGIAGQAGALTIPITGATAGSATFAVSGLGFTGSVTTTIAAGQNSVSIPITYDGTGTAGSKTLNVTSSQATGTCTPSVIVDPLLATFNFNCATATTTGVFIANGTAGQAGTITIPIANATAGITTFAVSGNGFSGSLSTTLTAGQTSVTFPISYNGSGVSGNHFVNITSAQAAGTCALNIIVVGVAGTFTFNCGAASISSHFVANGTAGQGGFLTIPISNAIEGKTTINVSGVGFTGSLTTTLTTNQAQVSIPITYNGAGAAGSRPLTVTSSQGVGTCTPNATVFAPMAVGAITFNCASTVATIGSFLANGTAQSGLISIDFTTQTAGEISVVIAGGGFSGSYVTSVVAGQTTLTMPVNYDGSGATGNHPVTITSSQATGTCATNIRVDALTDFACANYNTSSSFTADGTTQNGTLVIPLSNTTEGTATFTASGNGFTGSITVVLQDSQRFVAIPVVYDGSSPIGTHPVTVTSSQSNGACLANVKVKDPAEKGCDFLFTQPVSFLINSANTSGGYTTEYILVDANGVIKYRTATMPFNNVAQADYLGYAVNYTGTPPNLNVGTNLNAIGGSCANLSNALPIKMCGAYIFSCGSSTYAGAFVANGVGGQAGFIYVHLINALAIPTTISVSSGGFVGSVIVTLTPGKNIVPVPVVYDGSGTGGVIPVSITGINATGTCTVGVTVFPPPPAAPMSFNCGAPVVNGTFYANSSLQSGSITIPLTGAVAGTTNFTITGTGFSGGLTNTILTAGQTSITIPIVYDGRGPGGIYNIDINSPNATASCSAPITVLDVPAVYTFDCATASATGVFIANGTAGQTGNLTLPIIGQVGGTTTVTVSGTGFTGTFTGLITIAQSSIVVPITFDGMGMARSQTLTVTSPQAIGTCTPSVPVVCPTIAAPTTTTVQPTCTVATGTITVTAPTTGVTYSFDNGTTFQASATSSALAAGTYLTITKNTGTGCVSVANSTTLVAKDVPSAPTRTIVQPTCSVTTGTITVTNPTSGVTYSFDNGTTFQAAATSNALASGTYQVKVKDNVSNCVSTASPSVIDPILAVPSAPTTTVVQPTCAVTTGIITVTTPTSGVTYSFDNGTTFQASATSNALASGTYQVKVKDNVSNCVSTATPSVIDPILAVPSTPTTTVVQPTCAVTTGTITVTNPTSGVTYSFDNGTTFQASATSPALSSGTYQVKVKDDVSNCVSTATPSVIDPILAVPSAPTTTVVQPTCAVTTGTITVTNPTSGVTYSFDNGTTFQAAATSNALASGTYQVKVKDDVSNCVSTATPSVIDPILAVPSAPTATVVQPTCAVTTGTITITNPTSGVTYSFDNGTTFQAAATSNALASGTYQVKVKDKVSNCISTATPSVIDAILSVPSAPTTTIVQPTCATTTGTITVTNPTSGVTYSFDNGTTFQTSATSSALSSGTYQVKVKDNVSNCISTATPSVIDPILAVPSAPTTTVVQPTCAVTTGTITVTNPTSGVTYSFDNGTTFQTAATSNALSSGTYQVKVKDNVSNCVSTATPSVIDAILAVPSAPTTTVVQPTCAVTTGTITVTNPTSGVTYSFDNGTTFQVAATSPALASGTYQVKVKDNVSNCISTATPSVIDAILAVPSAPTTTIVQPTCAVTTGTITVTNLTSGVTYSFDNGTTFQASATSSALSSGTYQVRVKDNVSNCVSTATSSVIDAILAVPSAPTTTIVQPTCSVTTGTITVTNPTSGVTYSFDNGTTFQAAATSNALASGTYQVKVKDNVSNCVSTATPSVIDAILAVPSAPTTTIVQPTCAVTTGTITVTNPTSGVTYSFDNGTTFQTSATSNALASGTYQVKVKDNVSGCISTSTPSVIDPILAVPSAPTTTIVQPTCAVTTGTITVTNPISGVTYSFDNGTTFQASATSNALASGTYQVKVKDNVSGCESVATTSVINAALVVPSIGLVAKGDPSVFSCPLLNNGTIIVAATGANLQYSKDSGATWQASNSFTGLVAGSYTIKVRDSLTACESVYATNPVVLTAPSCVTPCDVPKPSITNH
jgi:hypothetical protein